MAKRVSMGDIAKEAGVSAMTVSRALKGDDKQISPAAIKQTMKIREIAERMGYRKSIAPRAMISGRFNAITLLGSTNWRKNQLSQVRMVGLQDQAKKNGVSLILSQADDEELLNATSLPKLIQEMASDGLLISYMAGYPEQFDNLLRRYNIPAIWMNSKHTADCIYPDDFSGVKTAVNYLIELGHQRIAAFFLRERDSVHYSVLDRRRGYEKALLNAQLPPIFIELQNSSDYHKYNSLMHSWLSRPDRPTAVIAYGLPHAIAVMTAAGKLGLKIPEDLSLIMFHEEKNAFQITSMEIPERELGEEAVKLLMEKISNPDKNLEPVVLPMSLELETATCGPAPKI